MFTPNAVVFNSESVSFISAGVKEKNHNKKYKGQKDCMDKWQALIT